MLSYSRTWPKAQSALGGLRSDDRANVAPLTALCAIPLVMIAGVAIDTSRLSSARVEVQAAVDAAALNAAAAYGTAAVPPKTRDRRGPRASTPVWLQQLVVGQSNWTSVQGSPV